MRIMTILLVLIILAFSAFIGVAAVSEARQTCPDLAGCADARKMAWVMLGSAALCTLSLLVAIFGKRRRA